jgi:acetyl esterase/lipase
VNSAFLKPAVFPVIYRSCEMKRLSCFLALMACSTAVAQTPAAPQAETKAGAAQAAPAKKGEARREERQADRAAAQQKKKQVTLPTPTAEISYGEQPRQKIWFWKAETTQPTPLLFFIHGGGWNGGDHTAVAGLLSPMLKEGISVASIEYRLVPEAQDVEPPVKAPLHDAARALQVVRSKAQEWNIDKTRIAASGGSAGACSSLWLAFHDDMADPNSPDPVARESTRLMTAAVTGAQTTLDPAQMKEWTPNSKYGAHAFKITAPADQSMTVFEAFLAKRNEIMPWIKEYSPYHNVSQGDPPIYLIYAAPPALGQDAKDPTHTANFGVKLQEHCKANGVECELMYPGAPKVKHESVAAYLIDVLKTK